MRYMLLIYTTETSNAATRAEVDSLTREETEQVMAAHRNLIRDAVEKGVFIAADPLEPTPSAKTVRLKDGKQLIVDGPFAETKEQLAGYYMLECSSMEEALQWALRIPTQCGGKAGSVEVRPIHPMAELPPRKEMQREALLV